MPLCCFVYNQLHSSYIVKIVMKIVNWAPVESTILGILRESCSCLEVSSSVGLEAGER